MQKLQANQQNMLFSLNKIWSEAKQVIRERYLVSFGERWFTPDKLNAFHSRLKASFESFNYFTIRTQRLFGIVW